MNQIEQKAKEIEWQWDSKLETWKAKIAETTAHIQEMEAKHNKHSRIMTKAKKIESELLSLNMEPLKA